MNYNKYSQSMRLLKKLFLFSIVLSTTQIIESPILGLSVFQLYFIFVVFISFVAIIASKKIRSGRYLLFIIIWLFSSVIAYLLSTYPSWAKSFFLLSLMFICIIIITNNFFNSDDLDDLLKALIRSQYIAIPLSIYSIYMFYFAGGIPLSIDLPLGLNIHVDKEFLLRTIAGNRIRLSFPYATPPVLSVAMAMSIVILLFNKQIFKKSIRVILISIFSAILIMTGSRTGIVGLVLTIGLWLIIATYKKKISPKTLFAFVFIVTFVYIILLILAKNVSYVSKFIQRFSGVDLNDRHFLIAYDGFLIWLSSIKNIVLGIGFGSSINYTGAHTALPAHLMNIFATLIVERGILGIVISFEFVLLLIKLMKTNEFLTNNNYTALCLCLAVGFISGLFYEVLDCYYLLFVIAISMMVRRDNYENCVCNYSRV